MILHLDLPQNGYDIILERGALFRAKELLDLDRRVLVVTDSGVPAQYAQAVAAQCREPVVVTVPEGEASKCFSSLEMLCRKLLAITPNSPSSILNSWTMCWRKRKNFLSC